MMMMMLVLEESVFQLQHLPNGVVHLLRRKYLFAWQSKEVLAWGVEYIRYESNDDFEVHGSRVREGRRNVIESSRMSFKSNLCHQYHHAMSLTRYVTSI